jgi:hypothetical protein
MRRLVFAAAAVLATGLSGVAAHPAMATATGCGVTVHVHNDTSSAITVQWDKSDSRAKVWVAGPWKKLGSGTTTIQAGNQASRAFNLDLSCSTEHQYRVHYTKGSSSGYAYFPKNTSNWTTTNSPNVHVK